MYGVARSRRDNARNASESAGENSKAQTGATEIALARTRTVRGQVQHRRGPGQALSPVVDQRCQRGPGETLALGGSEGRVVQRQRWHRRRMASSARIVGGLKVGHEQAERPAVTDDVVHREKQRMGVRRDAHQGGTKQWAACQIEGPCRFLTR